MASTHPHRGPDSRQGGLPGVVVPVGLGVLGLILGLVIVAIATSEWDLLAALGVLLGVLVIGLGVAAVLARNAVAHDEARIEAAAPLEMPDEVGVHDLPLDHPGRVDAERPDV